MLIIDTPVSYRFLPPLKLRNFMNLETKDLWPVSLSLESGSGGACTLHKTFCRNFRLVTPSTPAVAFRDTPCTDIDRAALWWDQVRVDEEKKVRKRSAEVCPVDSAMSR